MHLGKRIACAVLAGAMFLAAGCSGSDKSWVYRSGAIQPPAGVYLLQVIDASSDAEAKMMEETGLPLQIKYKEMLKRTVEDQPAESWITSQAQDKMRKFLAVEQQYTQRGLELSEQNRLNAKNSAANVWSNSGEIYEKNGIAQSSYQIQFENALKSNELFFHLYGEGGEYAASEKEIQDKLVADYPKVEMLYFVKTTGEDDGPEKAKKQAEEYMQRLKDGEAIEDLAYELDLERAGEEYSESVEKGTAEDQQVILMDDFVGIYSTEELLEGAKKMSVGEVAIVEDADLYYVLRRLDVLEDKEQLPTLREDALRKLKFEEYQALVEGWANELQVEVNQPALDTYRPSKLKLD